MDEVERLLFDNWIISMNTENTGKKEFSKQMREKIIRRNE